MGEKEYIDCGKEIICSSCGRKVFPEIKEELKILEGIGVECAEKTAFCPNCSEEIFLEEVFLENLRNRKEKIRKEKLIDTLSELIESETKLTPRELAEKIIKSNFIRKEEGEILVDEIDYFETKKLVDRILEISNEKQSSLEVLKTILSTEKRAINNFWKESLNEFANFLAKDCLNLDTKEISKALRIKSLHNIMETIHESAKKKFHL